MNDEGRPPAPALGTDTAGNLLDKLVAPADIHDRNGAPSLIERCRDA